MKPVRYFVALACVIQLCACASQWGLHPGDENVVKKDAKASGTKTIRLQQMSLEVSGVEMKSVRADDLQIGDILLSGMTSLKSSAIKLATFSEVSHAAVFVGDGRVVEAVGSGVRLYGIEQALSDGETIVAYRRPDMTPELQEKLRSFALGKVGLPYNMLGIAMQAPLSVERKFCEVPGLPGEIRDTCVRIMGSVQMAPTKLDRQQTYFCSELVLETFRAAGLPLVDVPSELVAPSDILHMREGDVSTFMVPRKLAYVGRIVAASEISSARLD